MNEWVGKFWDYRPFTRAVQSYRHSINLRDYIQINQWEGQGLGRGTAVNFMKQIASVRKKLDSIAADTIRGV